MVPFLSWLMVRSRCACARSPLIATAENPRERSRPCSSVACLVRTNTIIASNCSTFEETGQRVELALMRHLQIALGDIGGGLGLGL